MLPEGILSLGKCAKYRGEKSNQHGRSKWQLAKEAPLARVYIRPFAQKKSIAPRKSSTAE